jgi:hypothetical protein
VLREDLCTVRADPLPPSVWLRWLPHGLVCLTAFAMLTVGLEEYDGGSGSARTVHRSSRSTAAQRRIRLPPPVTPPP